MRFEDIIGFEEVKEKLIRSVKRDKLAHAILLSGEKGSPNLSLALAFSSYLNCEDPAPADSCGVCPACIKNSKFIHPDLNFVFPVTNKAGLKSRDVISKTFLTEWRTFLAEKPYASEDTWATYLGSEDKQFNISKEESRQIISNLSLKAFEGKYKIMLIWLPEYMHPAAANGILKILEEPADRTVFLLVTNDREKLLSTILSRTITVPVRKYHTDELISTLSVQYGMDADRSGQLARTSEGDLDSALRQSGDEGEELMVAFRKWLLMCHGLKRKDLVEFTEIFNKMNKVAQRAFMRYGNSVLREVLVLLSGAEQVTRYSPQEEDFLRKLSRLVSVGQLERMMDLFNGMMFDMERNVNPRIAFMDMSLKVGLVFRQK